MWKREGVLDIAIQITRTEATVYRSKCVPQYDNTQIATCHGDAYAAMPSIYFFLPAMATFLPCTRRQAMFLEDSFAV